jgi:hypothetical protein
MFYKLLGMAVWHGGKFALRRKYGSTYVPKSLLAGAVVAAVAVVALGVAARHSSSDD